MEEFVGAVVIIGLVCYGIYWVFVNWIIPFFTNVVFPFSGMLILITSGIGAFYAFCVSLRAFLKSLKNNWNPYETYIDKNSEAMAYVRRKYFFGPAWHQLKRVVREAYINLVQARNELNSFTEGKDLLENGIWMFIFRDLWIIIFIIAANLCIYIFGLAWLTLFCLVLTCVIAAGATVFFLFFSALWLIDRAVLLIKAIQCRCPKCKRSFVIPSFICPQCGKVHKHLTPGPYGVFHIKCTCGYALPVTIFNGRSKLKSLCPYCDTELFTSKSSQFGIQLVGGTSTGKTTYLAAFYHAYIETLNKKGVSYKIFPPEKFAELENFYKQGLSAATDEHNASMYSIVHKLDRDDSCQLSLYDIAGEAFLKLDEDQQQLHFSYCEGIIFIIDPTNSPDYVRENIAGFINEFKNLKNLAADEISNIPAAVIISKSDLFNKEIGLVKINTEHKKQGDGIAFDDTRNKICIDFLINHAFAPAVNLIEAEFKNINYFPVSAIGHNLDGKSYEPWGVLEPVLWIFKEADSVLYKLYNGMPFSSMSGISGRFKRKFIAAFMLAAFVFAYFAYSWRGTSSKTIKSSQTQEDVKYEMQADSVTENEPGSKNYAELQVKNDIKPENLNKSSPKADEARVKASAPPDAHMFEGHYYKVFYQSLTWADAVRKCEELGGHLCTVSSEREHKFIISLLPNDKKIYWLGASDINSEGKWEWVTSEAFNFTGWLKGEPNGGKQENYLMLTNYYQDKWGWNDGTEKPVYPAMFAYICEWERTKYNAVSFLDKIKTNAQMQAFNQPVIMSVKGTKINFRSAPDTDAESMLKLDEGTPVTVLKSSEQDDGKWLYVRLESLKEGWIHGNFVQDRISSHGAHGGKLMAIKGMYVNVRQNPDKKSVSLAKLHDGNLIEVIKSGWNWSQVYTIDGKQGWVDSRYIRRRQSF